MISTSTSIVVLWHSKLLCYATRMTINVLCVLFIFTVFLKFKKKSKKNLAAVLKAFHNIKYIGELLTDFHNSLFPILKHALSMQKKFNNV